MATRELHSTRLFGDYATVIFATGFLQSLFDLTVEEALVKYGFRYSTAGDSSKKNAQPIAVDYLHLRGADKGKVSRDIMEWIGEEVRFLIAATGRPRPTSFSAPGAGQTLSHWKRQSH